MEILRRDQLQWNVYLMFVKIYFLPHKMNGLIIKVHVQQLFFSHIKGKVWM